MKSLQLGLIAGSVLFSGLLTSPNVFAHAEHDKPRYLSAQGVDNGQCDLPKKPCLTLTYVAEHANKGDQILVAGGHYDISGPDSLFYLLSEMVPVKAGFSTKDHYQRQDIAANATYLTGVPIDFANDLRSKGFTVNTDQKQLSAKDAALLAKKLAQYESLSQRQTSTACVDGKAGLFSCNNISLQAHIPLNELGLSASSANDIWGFVDINTQREYAIIGQSNGVSVVDVTDPTAPSVVGSIASQNSGWRDIKVYQHFDQTDNRYKSYAYITADSASVGLMILDLSELPKAVSLANVDKTDLSAHNVYISNVDYSTGITLTGLDPYLHIIGSNNRGGAYNSYGLANPIAPDAAYVPVTQSNRYTHDAASMVIDGQRANNQCSSTSGVCEVFFDFNVNDIILWDKTDNGTPTVLSQTTYPQAAYIHSGWHSEDKMVALVHDELDERNFSLNSTVRLFDISDLSKPELLSIWTGPTKAIDHNGFVRGSRYYMSNYTRGLTILDISNPANPVDVGYFDTYPLSDNNQFNGAWGVYPFLPSGNILISDINSGLYILSDQTVGQSTQDSVRLNQKWYLAQEGENLTVNVNRVGNPAQAVSVQFETHIGSASSADFALTRGTLNWAANDTAAKQIVIDVSVDTLDEEFAETLFVRLFNPTGGLALASPNMATVYIDGVARSGGGEFLTDTITVKETDGTVVVQVTKTGDFNAPVSMAYQTSAGTATLNSDFEETSGTLELAARDMSNQQIVINLVNDDEAEGDESFVLNMVSQSDSLATQSITVIIRDDESNLPAEVVMGVDFSTAVGSSASLFATATDPEGFALSYQWSQVSGTEVTLNNATSSNPSFVAPTVAGPLVFELTVTDDFNVATTGQMTVTVSTDSTPPPTPPPVTPTPPSSGGGGGGGSLGWLMLLGLGLGAGRKVGLKS